MKYPLLVTLHGGFASPNVLWHPPPEWVGPRLDAAAHEHDRARSIVRWVGDPLGCLGQSLRLVGLSFVWEKRVEHLQPPARMRFIEGVAEELEALERRLRG